MFWKLILCHMCCNFHLQVGGLFFLILSEVSEKTEVLNLSILLFLLEKVSVYKYTLFKNFFSTLRTKNYCPILCPNFCYSFIIHICV